MKRAEAREMTTSSDKMVHVWRHRSDRTRWLIEGEKKRIEKKAKDDSQSSILTMRMTSCILDREQD